ncbi:hypothetical protein O7599_02180 [Streptomyces sp. WMMC500]|uniref:hypothetical protein n=1 Tax=Streptomyces sp. WMMC500 TaxID=3015154 RepID=UPI00248C222E|nr:hypothetical protein [Streptomyces sp. WMMC500]WBB61390.1 hypothetical protein O7599_02180 [Streptomyces sp. WMMC500]
MQPHADDLIRALDPLPYPQRLRELALAARRATGRGDLAALLDGLAGHGAYGRRLAAFAALVGRDAGFLAARLADTDPQVRAHGAKAVRQGLLADDAVLAAFHDATAVVRRQLVRAVVRGRRTAVAEALIGPVGEQWGDAEAARLLPACTEETVRRLLPALWPALSGPATLAGRHPGAVLDEAERQLAALAPGSRAAWWTRHADVVAPLADRAPDRVLELLERFCHGGLQPPVHDRLNRLVAADPGRTLRLLLAPERRRGTAGTRLSRTVLDRLVAAAPPELPELARLWQGTPENAAALTDLLRRTAPSRREALFDAAMAERDTAHDDFPPTLLDALPRERRAAEARRMAAQARERDAPPPVVLRAVACLPVAEARGELLAALRRSDPDERAGAYGLLLANAARSGHPEDVTSAVRLLAERLRNDQDPVRSVALRQLAETHPALFTADAADHLHRIAADAIAARDSSPATRGALRTLAVALLREHAAGGRPELVSFSLRTITRLTGHTGGADLGRLDTSLRRGQEHEVFDALEPWLEAGADKVDHGLTFALARALGRRAWGMPKLQEYLWQAVQFGNDATVRTAVSLWLEPRAGRGERVGRLLAQEPSAAVLPPVYQVLARTRTDLLDTVLGDTPPWGRFLTPRAPWTPPVVTPERWTPAQQAAAARLLARAAGDAGLPQHERVRALADAARIPGHGLDLVFRYTGAEDVALAEAALAALVWTDRPEEALPLLLAHAGGDRARVAVYAATRATLHAAPSRVEAALRPLLLPGPDGTAAGAKVTSRKEAVRLAATRLPAERAAALVVGAYELPEQHRDVRAACVAFAGGLLGRPEVWRMLETAAAGDPQVRLSLLRPQPRDLREEHRPRYAGLVEAASRTDDVQLARAAYASLAAWAPWSPTAADVLCAAVTDLGNRGTWDPAAHALVTLATTAPADDPAREPVVRAARELLTRAPGQPDAEPDRDLPARRRLASLVRRLTVRPPDLRGLLRPTLHALADVLAADDDFVPQAAVLRTETVDLEAGAPELTAALVDLAGLHAGRPVLAEVTAKALSRRLDRAARPGAPEARADAARALAAAGGHAEGLFAVALTRDTGARAGWPEPWRATLRTLRAHPRREVRDAALAVQTADE